MCVASAAIVSVCRTIASWHVPGCACFCFTSPSIRIRKKSGRSISRAEFLVELRSDSAGAGRVVQLVLQQPDRPPDGTAEWDNRPAHAWPGDHCHAVILFAGGPTRLKLSTVGMMAIYRRPCSFLIDTGLSNECVPLDSRVAFGVFWAALAHSTRPDSVVGRGQGAPPLAPRPHPGLNAKKLAPGPTA